MGRAVGCATTARCRRGPGRVHSPTTLGVLVAFPSARIIGFIPGASLSKLIALATAAARGDASAHACSTRHSCGIRMMA